MTIQQLKRIPGQPETFVRTPRCEAIVSKASTFEQEWREGRYGPSPQPFQCVRPSVVRIDEKCYCRAHAGYLVLDMWIKGKLVEAPE